MSDNKDKPLTLKEVFLNENEMSRLYGLDKDTPKNVYVPNTTPNRVIAMDDEEPYRGEPGDGAMIDEEGCGCGESSGPHIHRVGAPGGPNLASGPAGPGTVDVDHPEGMVVLFDTDEDMYGEADVHSTGGPSKEGSVMLADGDDTEMDPHAASAGGYNHPDWPHDYPDEPFQDLDQSEEDYDENITGYGDFEAEMEWDEYEDRYANDWKPRPKGVAESFGQPIDDDWLEFI